MKEKSKVIVLPCEEYDEEKIYALLKDRTQDQLGGLRSADWKRRKNPFKAQPSEKGRSGKGSHHTSCGSRGFCAVFLREGIPEHCAGRFLRPWNHQTGVIQGTGMDTYLEKYQIPAIDYTKGVHVE